MKRILLTFGSLAGALALGGCAMPSAILSGATPVVATHALQLTGNVHGGQQPVNGATVTLWAAGTASGYGQGSVQVATTKTASDGTFGFSAGTCTTGQLLYITATGGNPTGGDPTVQNGYIAVMAALPNACSPDTPNNVVSINEISTIASVWSLQQFMSITPGAAVPWTIGSSATNVTGMTNAFAGTTEMVPLYSGTAQASTISNTINGVTYLTVITPDVLRVNTLGDILATCINSDGVTADGSLCDAIMTDVTPSGKTKPTDTIQAAYYLATNPAGLTMPQHATANGSPTYLCNTYVNAQAPFQNTTPCANVGDWTLTVSWRTTVSGSSTAIGTVAPASLAIDSAGNIWTGVTSSTVTTNILNQFRPYGMLNITPISSVALPTQTVNFVVAGAVTPETYTAPANNQFALTYSRPFGLAVDTNNNAWYSSFTASPGTLTGTSSTGATVTLTSGFLAQITPAGAATGFITGNSPGALAIDGSNNVFLSNKTDASHYLLSDLNAASGYTTLNKGNGAASSIYNDVLIDTNNFIWGMYSGTTCTTPVQRENDAAAAAQVTTNNVTTTVCNYYGSTDKFGNAYTTQTVNGSLSYTNIAPGVTTPVITTVGGSTNAVATGKGGFAGLDLPQGSAVDGLGNVWVANRLASAIVSGISEFTPTTTGTTTTFTALSEGGTVAGQFGFQPGGATSIQGVTLDSSGNVWFNTTANSLLYHMVGAAAPVATPVAQAVANGQGIGGIGTRP